MSINFPTAFWKNQSEEADVVPTDVENTQITWSKYLYYGYNNPEIVEGSDPVEYENGLNPQAYKLVGGDDLLEWLNDKLTRERKIVDSTKRTKMNAGLENQFKKTHTKNKSKNPTKVRLVSTQKTSDEIFNNRAVSEEMTRINEIIKKIII